MGAAGDAGDGLSTNTPPCHLGYTIPGTPTAYYASNTTGSIAALESVGSGSVEQLVSGSATDAEGQVTRYTYDLRGNVISTDPDGNVTRDAYDAEGHKVAEVDANHNAQTWRYDYFGQAQSHTDIGGAQYFYTYDNARQLVQQSNTRGMNQTLSYDVAGHVTQITDNALGQVTQYAYDASGNRIREVTIQNGVVYQDNHLAYDALDRLRRVEDGNVSIVYDYDADGNRTRIYTQYENVSGGGAGQVQYFAYDSMNRETVADAVDPYGNITQGQGHRMTYDLNGNRTSDTSIGAVMVNGAKSIGTVVQNYAYDSLNRLVMTKYNGTVIDQRQYDADGRVVLSGLGSGVSQSFFDTLGLSDQVQFNEYDGAGRLLFQRNYNANWQEQDNVSYTSYDAVGNVLQYHVNSVQGTAYTNTYTNTLVRYSGYEVATQSGTSTVLQSGQTNYQYDVNGNLVGLTDSTDNANNRSFVNDVNGQILQKTQGSAVEHELIANGNLVGTTGMGTDPNGVSSGPNPTFVDLTNFDPTYRPINANFPAPTPGAYTVNAGDTLQSIAQGAYGDSKLWYLIADANGLSSNNDLRVGQTLNIPNRVTDVHNSSSDFKPYDAGSVVGSTTPNLPDPPAQSDGGCGAILGIIVLVIVVIVTVIAQQYEALPGEASAEAGAGGAVDAGIDSGVAAGTSVSTGASVFGANTFGFTMAGTGASTMGTLAVAAATGAAVDAASQLVGDALGTHHGFDLLETLEAAGTSMILPGAGTAGNTLERVGEQALRGALVNAATQGIRLATHQQESFNWGQLALSAAAAPLASAVGQHVGDALGHLNLPSTFDKIISGMASSATTQLATGGKIDIGSVASDAFGNVLGNDAYAEAQNVGQQLQTLAQTQQSTAQASTGFDTNAAYAQLVDAFSNASDPVPRDSGTLFASNDLTPPGQQSVVSDAGGGGSGMPTIVLPTIYVTPDPTFGDGASGGSIVSDPQVSYVDSNGATHWDSGAISSPIAAPDVSAEPLPEGPISTGLGSISPTPSLGQQLFNIGGAVWNGQVGIGQGADMAWGAIRSDLNATFSNGGTTSGNFVMPQVDAMGNATGLTEDLSANSGPQMSYGDQMAHVGQFSGQFSVGFGKGVVNGIPSTLMGLASGITQGSIMQGELEAGVDPSAALNDARQATANWWNGQIFHYGNNAQQLGGFAGELFAPTADAKAIELGVDGLKALGPVLDGAVTLYGYKSGLTSYVMPPSRTGIFSDAVTSTEEAAGRETLAEGATSTPKAYRTFSNVDDFNRAANAAEPNTVYAYGGYRWTTDELGRVVSAEGRVNIAPLDGRAGTDGMSTVNIGKGPDAQSGDIGFHLIGDQFGGPTNQLNVVPGNGVPENGLPNLNQGPYASWERSVRNLAADPANGPVEMRVEPMYYEGNRTTRPDSFYASYRVNSGDWVTRIFRNRAGG